MGYSINQPAPHNALGPQGVGAYWSPPVQFIFRVAAIYFTLQCIPLDARFYRFLFSINWLHLQFSDVFALARYTPRFFSSTESYADWGIIFLIALVAAVGWTYADRQRFKPYNEVFYWVRTIVRYRLAIAVIAYGFIKF
ncbi:MAG TPA: hypothetical protein VL307_04425, partial [Chitinophagaceae bacterium]|nr:hypothetical protein [Chitinophagaceae bacterium]